MRAASLFAASLSAGLAAAQATQDAPKISGNPTDVVYKASLPDQAFFTKGSLDGNVKGSITAQAPEDGVGVKFSVRFENIPKEGGPFIYHIHVNPVVDGNCTKTLTHLDPFNRGEKPPCDASAPQTCQVGDLSGKYGSVTQDPFVAEYVDPFTSLKEGDQAFFGNRSFVFHFGNTTRITCANFVKENDSQGASPSGTYGPPQPSTSASGTYGQPTRAAGGVTNIPAGTGGVVGPANSAVPVTGSAALNKLSLPLLAAAAAAIAFVM
ncbi:hypothetical protein CDD83_11149 [Cordyceps sp. RAO-2017]|nr:hypothetical protein CDD83_11149 [Cordyceps sp. RAO-2017]